MKCLVTGNAGFIGSHVVDELIVQGHEVFCIDNLSTGKRKNINKKCVFEKWDIKNILEEESWKHWDGDSVLGQKFDVVFHLAAKANLQASITDPVDSNEENVRGTLNVLEYARKTGAAVVFSSSSAVYGDAEVKPTSESNPLNPMSPYALQKQIGEQYLELYNKIYGLKGVALRYFNVFGERQPESGSYQTVMGIFSNQLKEGKSLTIVGTGEQRRDFVYVKDVAKANVKAGELALIGEKSFNIFNIGSGKNYSVNEVAELMDKWREHGRKQLPKRTEPMQTLANIEKAKTLLNWVPKTTLQNYVTTLQK